jgi:hypothetical protein
MALVIENVDGEFVRAYMNVKGSQPDKDYMSALDACPTCFLTNHAMMRFELTGGF